MSHMVSTAKQTQDVNKWVTFYCRHPKLPLLRPCKSLPGASAAPPLPRPAAFNPSSWSLPCLSLLSALPSFFTDHRWAPRRSLPCTLLPWLAKYLRAGFAVICSFWSILSIIRMNKLRVLLAPLWYLIVEYLFPRNSRHKQTLAVFMGGVFHSNLMWLFLALCWMSARNHLPAGDCNCV